MKLKVLEQIHISSVSSETLRRGQEIEVSDATGEELLAKHADKFELLMAQRSAKAAVAAVNKQAPAPKNKSVP